MSCPSFARWFFVSLSLLWEAGVYPGAATALFCPLLLSFPHPREEKERALLCAYKAGTKTNRGRGSIANVGKAARIFWGIVSCHVVEGTMVGYPTYFRIFLKKPFIFGKHLKLTKFLTFFNLSRRAQLQQTKMTSTPPDNSITGKILYFKVVYRTPTFKLT